VGWGTEEGRRGGGERENLILRLIVYFRFVNTFVHFRFDKLYFVYFSFEDTSSYLLIRVFVSLVTSYD
jgi:hypothetical protein